MVAETQVISQTEAEGGMGINSEEVRDSRFPELSQQYGEKKTRAFLLLEKEGFLELVKYDGTQSLDTSEAPGFIPSINFEKITNISEAETHSLVKELELVTGEEIISAITIPETEYLPSVHTSTFSSRELFFYAFYDPEGKVIIPGVIQGREVDGIKPILSVPEAANKPTTFSDGHIDLRDIPLNDSELTFSGSYAIVGI